jgi:anti-sigma factor RsiW
MTESSHARIEEQFSSYLEGDLPPPSRRSLEEHMAGCPGCRAQLASFRSTLGKLGGLREKAPPAFLAGIEAQIRRRSGGRFFARRRLLFGRVPFEWASLVMILAMLVYFVLTQHASPTGVIPGP